MFPDNTKFTSASPIERGSDNKNKILIYRLVGVIAFLKY